MAVHIGEVLAAVVEHLLRLWRNRAAAVGLNGILSRGVAALPKGVSALVEKQDGLRRNADVLLVDHDVPFGLANRVPCDGVSAEVLPDWIRGADIHALSEVVVLLQDCVPGEEPLCLGVIAESVNGAVAPRQHVAAVVSGIHADHMRELRHVVQARSLLRLLPRRREHGKQNRRQDRNDPDHDE